MAVPRAEHINPFIRANIEAMEMMVGIALENKSVRLKGEGDTNSDISGVLGFAGDLVGSVVLNFPKETAYQIVSRFLDVPADDLSAESVYDAVGELANIVGGGAKSKLSGEGVRFEIGLPCIIVGRHHQIFRGVDAPTVSIGFESDVGAFQLEVCLRPAEA